MFQNTGKHRKEFLGRIDAESAAQSRLKERLSLRSKRREECRKRRRPIQVKETIEKNKTNDVVKPDESIQNPQPIVNNEETPDIPPTAWKFLVQQITSSNHEIRSQALVRARKCLCLAFCDMDCVFGIGFIPALLQILANDNESSFFQVESAWCLSNITTASENITQEIVDNQGIKILLKILEKDERNDLSDYVITALGNLAAETPVYRKEIVDLKGIRILFDIVGSHSDNRQLVHISSWALSLVTQDGVDPECFLQTAYLANLLSEVDDDELWISACWIGVNLMQSSNIPYEQFMNLGTLPIIINLCTYPRFQIRLASLRCMSTCIYNHEDALFEYLVDSGVMDKCGEIFKEEDQLCDERQNAKVRAEALRLLSSLARGGPQVRLIINLNIIHNIFDIIVLSTFELKREALFFFDTMIQNGTNKHVKYLVNAGLVKFLMEQFKLQNVELDHVILDTIYTILQVGETLGVKTNSRYNAFLRVFENNNIMNHLYRIQNSENEDLVTFADLIMDTFFSQC